MIKWAHLSATRNQRKVECWSRNHASLAVLHEQVSLNLLSDTMSHEIRTPTIMFWVPRDQLKDTDQDPVAVMPIILTQQAKEPLAILNDVLITSHRRGQAITLRSRQAHRFASDNQDTYQLMEAHARRSVDFRISISKAMFTVIAWRCDTN